MDIIGDITILLKRIFFELSKRRRKGAAVLIPFTLECYFLINPYYIRNDVHEIVLLS